MNRIILKAEGGSRKAEGGNLVLIFFFNLTL